jgi:hypothetical protein
MPCPQETDPILSADREEQLHAARLGFFASLRLGEQAWAERHVPPGLSEDERADLLIDLLTDELAYRLQHLDAATRRRWAGQLLAAWGSPEQVFADACRSDAAPQGSTPASPEPAWGGDEPVQGRPLRARQRVVFWCRERPVLAALLVVALVLASVVGWGYYNVLLAGTSPTAPAQERFVTPGRTPPAR